MRTVPLLMALMLIAACHSTSRTMPMGASPIPSVLTKADSEIDTVRSLFFSEVEIAAHLRPLERASLPPGTRELRVWLIGGWAIGDLYRIASRGGGIEGQWIRFWNSEDVVDSASGIPVPARFRYDFAGRCDAMRTFGNTDICVARWTRRPDWSALLRKLESDSAWTLPDQKKNPNVVVLDGAEIIVELREGTEYRTYDYDVTFVRADDVEGNRAEAMWTDVSSLSSLLAEHPSSSIFRGRLGGTRAYPELVACGATNPWGLWGKLEALRQLGNGGPRPIAADTLRGSYVVLRGIKAYPGMAKQSDRGYPELVRVDSVLHVKPWNPDRCR